MALTLNRGAARLLPNLYKCAPISTAVSATRSSQRNTVHDSHASAINARRFHVGSALRNIINIQDEADFKKRVVSSSLPVIVDFHATWCGPCKLLGPKLEAMVSRHEGRLLMAKVDIDENHELALGYQVRAVPTVMAFKEGKVVDGFMGLKDDDQLNSFVLNVIG